MFPILICSIKKKVNIFWIIKLIKTLKFDFLYIIILLFNQITLAKCSNFKS